VNTDSLTDTQRRVFDHLVLGKSNKEIASAVSLAEASVKGHITAIMTKFNCKSRCKVIARHYLEQA
jgi:DNA-binding NarL/FixJ family response regulator